MGRSETGETTGEAHQGGAGQSTRQETESKARHDKTEDQTIKIIQEAGQTDKT